jgi:sensor histidine kinase YesM
MNEVVSLVNIVLLLVSTVTVLQRLFSTRFHSGICVLLILIVCAFHLGVIRLFGPINFNYGGLRVLLYFPLSLYLFKGPVFQKVFAFSLQLVLIISTTTLIEEIAWYVFGENSTTGNVFRLFMLLPCYIFYTVLATKNARIIYEKLFAYGSTKAWALYSLVEMLSFGMMALVRLTVANGLVSIAGIFFVLLSSAVLCYAIVNTHEKTRQRIDAEFALGIVSAGREHYQKMNDMYDKLRKLRHDYKYHLNAIQHMLNSGSAEAADTYLAVVEKQIADTEIPKYCGNAVLNALIYSYAERCAALDIQFNTRVSIPVSLTVLDYDMCIIFGNLLENAVEACVKLNADRYIEVTTQNTPTQLLVMVKNSFDGMVREEEGVPVSSKTEGGLGLRSIKQVVAHYGGVLVTEWDNSTFVAYTSMRL